MENNKEEKTTGKGIFEDSIVNKKSFKRVLIAISFLILCVSFFMDMFDKFDVNVEFASIFAWIIGAGLFGVASEKFSITKRR